MEHIKNTYRKSITKCVYNVLQTKKLRNVYRIYTKCIYLILYSRDYLSLEKFKLQIFLIFYKYQYTIFEEVDRKFCNQLPRNRKDALVDKGIEVSPLHGNSQSILNKYSAYSRWILSNTTPMPLKEIVRFYPTFYLIIRVSNFLC